MNVFCMTRGIEWNRMKYKLYKYNVNRNNILIKYRKYNNKMNIYSSKLYNFVYNIFFY